ncbi:hypothetical protein [Burkholderia ubonensis]
MSYILNYAGLTISTIPAVMKRSFSPC